VVLETLAAQEPGQVVGLVDREFLPAQSEERQELRHRAASP